MSGSGDVVEVRRILRLPLEEAGRRREIHARTGVGDLDGLRQDVAVGKPLEVARDVERVGADRRQVVEGVVAVAGTLAVEHRARLPARVRLPQQLSLAEDGGPRVEVVAREVVLRKACPRRVAEPDTRGECVGDNRTRGGAAQVAGVEVAVRTAQAAAPFRERGTRARDVDDAAKRVASEERALRTAHELDLLDVDQFDARGVGVELRHAVDVTGDAGIGRSRANAAEARVAQLSHREFVEVGVGCIAGGIAHAAHRGLLECALRNGGHTDRERLRIGRFLLRRDGQRRQREADDRRRGRVRLGVRVR